MKTIDSTIFGKTTLLDYDDEDYKKLKDLITTYPVNTFGILNKLINERGFRTIIDVYPAEKRS